MYECIYVCVYIHISIFIQETCTLRGPGPGRARAGTRPGSARGCGEQRRVSGERAAPGRTGPMQGICLPSKYIYGYIYIYIYIHIYIYISIYIYIYISIYIPQFKEICGIVFFP